jgi:hypothetical protein
VGAPAQGDCGAAYLFAWRDGEGDASSEVNAGGRKFVAPCSVTLGDRVGGSVLVADFLGTGVPGVAVGAPRADGASASPHAGAVWLILDTAAADHDGGVVYLDDVGVRLTGETDEAAFGTALAAPDLLGAGTPMLLVGSPGVENGVPLAGSAYLYAEPTTLTSGVATDDASRVLRSFQRGALLGTAVAAVPRGDSPDDLAVSAPGWDDESGSVGAVFLLDEAAIEAEDPLLQARVLLGEAESTGFGTTLGGGGVLSGLLIGAPAASPGDANGAGVAWWWSP